MQQHHGIDLVGLTTHHLRLGKAAGGPGVQHHQLDARRPIQSQGKLQMIDAGRFQTDTHPVAATLEPGDGLLMTAFSVSERAVRDRFTTTFLDVESLVCNVDAGKVHCLLLSPGLK